MNHPNAPFGPHRRPGYHPRSPRHHWGAQTHLVELFMGSGDNVRPWEWSRGCPVFDRFSRRSSKSVVSPTSVLDFTRPLDGKIPSSNLSETTHVKIAPKNDRIALHGGLFEVGGVGPAGPTEGNSIQSSTIPYASPKKLRRQSAWADRPSIRDPSGSLGS